MFAQVIRGKASDPNAVRARLDRWMTDLEPNAKGWLGTTSGVTEQGDVVAIVRFETEEVARANSDKPEQGEWWAETEKVLAGEAAFEDSTKVYFDTNGDLSLTGFVQIRLGHVSDGDRMLALIEGNSSWRTSRPEILGIMGVVSAGGQFTNAVYFTSYEAAHGLDDSEAIPADVRARGAEMMSLLGGELEYLDLKNPWLDAPK
jgi:hypothetical protein